jgi:hypothetical protein
MREMSSVKKSTICALCIALCYVLPMAFHAINLGSVFSPMHLPVFICGLICGGGYGLFCGIVGPIISCLLTGMPTVAGLPTMAVELGPVKAFLTHGHLYNVSPWHIDSLVYAAEEQGATLALFGHTHKAAWTELGGVTLVNPGTAGSGAELTWALVTVFDNGAISCDFYNLK